MRTNSVSAKPENPFEEKRSDILSKVKPSGQMPCLLVYSDSKHVNYINELVNWVDEVLPKMGFTVNKLCLKTLPDEHFGEKFEKLADECALGIVLLDGFRPNVLFEYGFLRGKGKVALPIQDKDAFISVKSFYQLTDPPDENQLRKITGLTETQFSHLIQPPLEHFGQISDRHGINVVEVDRHSESTSDKHPKQKLKSEITKLMPKIIEKYANDSVQAIGQKTPAYLQEFQELTLSILRFYMKVEPVKSEDLKSIMASVDRLEKASNVNLPGMTYGFIAGLYSSLAEQSVLFNAEESKGFYATAIKLWKRILKIDTRAKMRSYAFMSLGNTFLELSRIREREPNLNLALNAFNKAYVLYTKTGIPIDCAMAKHNIGAAYLELSGIKPGQFRESFLSKAIETLEEVRDTFKETSPENYRISMNTLGIAYSRLSEIKDTETYLKKSIDTYNAILEVIKKKDTAIDYANTQHELANVYANFSEIRDRDTYLHKAEQAYNEALSVYTKDKMPLEYASTMLNFGTIYGKFLTHSAPEKSKANYLAKSIECYTEALTVFSRKNTPFQYAKVKINLAISYANSVSIEKSKKDKVKAINQAIKVLKESLRIFTKKKFPFDFAIGQNNLGNMYGMLSEYYHTETYLARSLLAYNEALAVYTKKDFQYDYAFVKHNVGCTYRRLATIIDREINLNKAIEAFDEALTIFTNESFPEKFEDLMNKLNRTLQEYGSR
jgi:tetratricopeptide (TPR) repeat protein